METTILRFFLENGTLKKAGAYLEHNLETTKSPLYGVKAVRNKDLAPNEIKWINNE